MAQYSHYLDCLGELPARYFIPLRLAQPDYWVWKCTVWEAAVNLIGAERDLMDYVWSLCRQLDNSNIVAVKIVQPELP